MSVNEESWKEVAVLKHDLRAILFWAAVGLSNSNSGSYRDAEGEHGIVDSYAKSIKFALPVRPCFKEGSK